MNVVLQWSVCPPLPCSAGYGAPRSAPTAQERREGVHGRPWLQGQAGTCGRPGPVPAAETFSASLPLSPFPERQSGEVTFSVSRGHSSSSTADMGLCCFQSGPHHPLPSDSSDCGAPAGWRQRPVLFGDLVAGDVEIAWWSPEEQSHLRALPLSLPSPRPELQALGSAGTEVGCIRGPERTACTASRGPASQTP